MGANTAGSTPPILTFDRDRRRDWLLVHGYRSFGAALRIGAHLVLFMNSFVVCLVHANVTVSSYGRRLDGKVHVCFS